VDLRLMEDCAWVLDVQKMDLCMGRGTQVSGAMVFISNWIGSFLYIHFLRWFRRIRGRRRFGHRRKVISWSSQLGVFSTPMNHHIILIVDLGFAL